MGCWLGEWDRRCTKHLKRSDVDLLWDPDTLFVTNGLGEPKLVCGRYKL